MYEVREFPHLLKLKAFSAPMMEQHLKLYKGYVENTNKALDVTIGEALSLEVQRRFSWEYNGMKLHELFFESLTSTETLPLSTIKLDKVEALTKMRGIGWIAVSLADEGEFQYNWIEQHNQGPLVNTQTLLVLDMWEHAYLPDFGLDKKKYFDSWVASINWEVVQKRLQSASSALMEKKSWRHNIR